MSAQGWPRAVLGKKSLLGDRHLLNVFLVFDLLMLTFELPGPSPAYAATQDRSWSTVFTLHLPLQTFPKLSAPTGTAQGSSLGFF